MGAVGMRQNPPKTRERSVHTATLQNTSGIHRPGTLTHTSPKIRGPNAPHRQEIERGGNIEAMGRMGRPGRAGEELGGIARPPARHPALPIFPVSDVSVVPHSPA